MGDDPALNQLRKAALTIGLIAIAGLAQRAVVALTENITMPTSAQGYIDAFQRGEAFSPPAAGLIVGGQPDAAAMQVLGAELSIASPSVRESIVRLLTDVGLRTDPLTPKGAETLRNPEIIEMLVGAGLAKPDLAREAAMEVLRKLVTQPDLAKFGDTFVKALGDAPTEEAFLLVAKAKPHNGAVVVDRLARLPEWRDSEAVKIARAALGAKEVEDEFLAAAETATDGRGLAQALGPLALIGTPRSLKAIAMYLRTPLTIEVPNAFEKSIRLNVLEALLYNFPDQPVLYPNNIVSEADFTAAERFCTTILGVAYTSPPPPFMTYRGYPF